VKVSAKGHQPPVTCGDNRSTPISHRRVEPCSARVASVCLSTLVELSGRCWLAASRTVAQLQTGNCHDSIVQSAWIQQITERGSPPSPQPSKTSWATADADERVTLCVLWRGLGRLQERHDGERRAAGKGDALSSMRAVDVNASCGCQHQRGCLKEPDHSCFGRVEGARLLRSVQRWLA
jgi:hypothetical protein